MAFYYFLYAFLVSRALGSPNGAPLQACSSMTPGHGFKPQSEVSPFIILPLMEEVMQGMFVPVSLSSLTVDYFRGFLLMAFNDEDEPIGRFFIEGTNGRLKSCPNGTDNAVTHSTNNDKSFVHFNWMPPNYFTGPVHFRATFVKNVSHYWVNTKPSVVNVVPFMPSSAINFASASSLMALPLFALIVGVF